MVSGETRSTEQKCYMQKDIDALEKFQKGQSPLAAPCRASDYKALGNVTSYTLTCQMNGNKSVSAVTAIYDASMIHGRITNADGNVSTFVDSRIGNCGWSPFGK